MKTLIFLGIAGFLLLKYTNIASVIKDKLPIISGLVSVVEFTNKESK